MVPLRLFALLAALALGAPRTAAGQDSVAVIVHPALSEAVDEATVRRVFLARQRFWANGIAVRPVNQGPRTSIRDAFSRRVLGGRVQDFTTYWNDLYFHGTSPPPTLASDEAVLLFVGRTPGAIGYVSLSDARLAGAQVRIVLLLPMT